MRSFEYKLVIAKDLEPLNIFHPELGEDELEATRLRFEGWLNEQGEQGWQFMARGERSFILMREKE